MAENIAGLLGPQISDLLPIEAALLILAAYYHDIGMVFSEEERRQLQADPDWNEFLERNPQAFVELTKAQRGAVPTEIAEWFCRWRHADRVYVHLHHLVQESPEKLKWGAVSLLEILGELCRSHDKKVSELQANPELAVDGLDGVDLRFCAILLRLGDILDFDGSRSPDSAYRYLGLSRRDTPRTTRSDVEWQKHLSSDGIRFPAVRGKRYELRFSAGPDRPAVEHDVRQFLAEIENELERCAALLPACSDRWRDLELPMTIDRDNIRSSGYRYGEYRFTLDQDHVLQLLMGENLYDSPYVFVRELLQNAIDATRLRAHLEHARGNLTFKPQPIRVSEWTDAEQFRWVRFDDEGTGMDEPIIRNYLLKVGSSYYCSAQFMADMLRTTAPDAPQFVPISRFGIGLLSCFIACDRIEISTLRQAPPGQKAAPIRLSLDGLRGFFELRTHPLVPTPMPSDGSDGVVSQKYRTTPGTSIACRLDPTKEQGAFQLLEILNQCLLAPPVPVHFEGVSLGGDADSMSSEPWVDPSTKTMNTGDATKVSSDLGIELSESAVSVSIKQIDLSKYSPVPELSGGFVWARMKVRQDLTDLIGGGPLPERPVTATLGTGVVVGPSFSPASHHLPYSFSVSFRINDQFIRGRSYDRLTPDQQHWITRISQRHGTGQPYIAATVVPDVVPNKTMQTLFRQHKSNLLISHNGLRIPAFRTAQLHLPDGVAWAALFLRDRLRPDLSISRDEMRGVPWEIHSAVALAIRRALAREDLDAKRLLRMDALSAVKLSPTAAMRYAGDPFRMLSALEYLSLRRLAEDPLLDGPEHWRYEPLFVVSGEPQPLLTLTEVLARVKAGNDTILELTGIEHGGPPAICAAAAIANRSLDMALVPHTRKGAPAAVRVNGARQQPLAPVELLFAPLTFLPFQGSDLLRGVEGLLNANHPFAAWLLQTPPDLELRFPGFVRAIRTNLLGFGIKPSQAVQGMTSLLERLRQLAPDLKLAKASYPTLADFPPDG